MRNFRGSSLKKVLKYQLQDDTSLNLVFYCRRVAHRLVAQFASLKQYFIPIPDGIGSCQSRVWHGWGEYRYDNLNHVFYLGGLNRCWICSLRTENTIMFGISRMIQWELDAIFYPYVTDPRPCPQQQVVIHPRETTVLYETVRDIIIVYRTSNYPLS